MPGPIPLEDFDGPAAAPEAEAGPAAAEAAEAPDDPAPLPVPDPEAERAAALARIARALETVAAEQAELRAHCIGQATAALGAVAELLLPSLARAGFAALVAETARIAAGHGRWPELAVTLAPHAADEVAAHLADGALAARIRIEPAPGAPSGEASISWDSGGAEIDVAEISESVLAAYRQKLDSISQTGA